MSVKITSENQFGEKNDTMTIQSQSNQRSENAQTTMIQIEIPFRWYMTHCGSPYIVINFMIDKTTKINMIEKAIRYYICKQSFENKSFAFIKRFRYESSKCVFNTKKKEYNDNDNIFDVISLNDIPNRIRFNSGTKNGYQVSLKVKPQLTDVTNKDDEKKCENKEEENDLFDKLFGVKLESTTKVDKFLNDIYWDKGFMTMSNEQLAVELGCFYKKHFQASYTKLENREIETKYCEKYVKLSKIVTELYNNVKHKEMEYPLCEAFIFALYLCASDEMDIDQTLKTLRQEIQQMSKNEINDQFTHEWNDIAIFNYCAYYGAKILTYFKDQKNGNQPV